MVEGDSINATVRMTDVSKPTILKLLAKLGSACSKYQDTAIRNVHASRVQVDEIWQYVYAKAKNVPKEKRGTFGYGDVWTWVALDPDTKLVCSWLVGMRGPNEAVDFLRDLAPRLRNRVQLTTDGLKSYLYAVDATFKGEIDYAQLHKVYASTSGGPGRYSPPPGPAPPGTRRASTARS